MQKIIKKIIITLLITTTTNITLANDKASKQEKLSQLFHAMNTKEFYLKTYAPIFASLNITEDLTKNKIIETFFDSLKKEFILIYDKNFTESEIEDIFKFYVSEAGKKTIAKRFQIDSDLAPAYMNIMKIIQEITNTSDNTKRGIQSEPEHDSTSVIKFETLVKDQKNSQEIFKNEINHDGITAVKFSATWCGPCKLYAPIFSQVAEEVKNLTINGKAISVKCLAIDVDSFPAIAKYCKVTAMPTTIFFKNGLRDKETIVGLRDKEVIIKKIKALAQDN